MKHRVNNAFWNELSKNKEKSNEIFSEVATYWWAYLSKLCVVNENEPSTDSPSTSSSCFTAFDTAPEWNSAPVGLKCESIENFRTVFVILSLFWKQEAKY